MSGERFVVTLLKAGVQVNRSEIWGNIKGELLGLKWVGNTILPDSWPPKRELQVGSRLFGIRLLILHFKFQLSKFHIFLNLTHPLRKKTLFPKEPKNHPKNLQKPPNSG